MSINISQVAFKEIQRAIENGVEIILETKTGSQVTLEPGQQQNTYSYAKPARKSIIELGEHMGYTYYLCSCNRVRGELSPSGNCRVCDKGVFTLSATGRSSTHAFANARYFKFI